MSGISAPHHHGYPWRRVTHHGQAGEALSARHPYEFVAWLLLLFIVVNVGLGSLSGLLPYPVLAICAIWLITKKRWWRVTGFTYPKGSGRSLLLFVPVFVPLLWWPFLAPLVGYGTLKVPSAVALYAVLMLLVGFVEEVYFRGLMLQPLRSQGAWHAVIITSVLFGVAHSLKALYGQSIVYTMLQVGYAIGLGLAFAALVLVTRLIWPLILAHGLINFTATLNSAAGVTSTTVRAADYWLAAGLLLFGAAYAVFLLRRYPQPSPVNA
jgi:membrane protease YdiL (CAAX protease family)